jgi:hypothetical protein
MKLPTKQILRILDHLHRLQEQGVEDILWSTRSPRKPKSNPKKEPIVSVAPTASMPRKKKKKSKGTTVKSLRKYPDEPEEFRRDSWARFKELNSYIRPVSGGLPSLGKKR